MTPASFFGSDVSVVSPKPKQRTALGQLTAARALLKAGWCKSKGRTKQEGVPDQYCALGALAEVSGFASWAHVGDTKSFRALRKALPKDVDKDVVRYNDRADTTQRDIVNLFSRAIKLVKNGGVK